jgi:acyl-CoA thioesterase II
VTSETAAVSFPELMTLRPLGGERFAAAGPQYPWGVLYGGQVIAQALRAAGETVRADEHVHSLHAYYLRSGRDSDGIELEVARVRDGRSFSVRAVTVRQGAAVIATVLASFHIEESSEVLPSATPPAVAAPDRLEPGGWTSLYDRRYAPVDEPARTLAWVRLTDELGRDPDLQACALVFTADDIFDDAVLALVHPGRLPANDLSERDWSLSTQSLDYSVWFHRRIRTDGWRLHDFRCRALANACATVVGEVFDNAGTHLATVAQQMLVRHVSSGELCRGTPATN